jgi:hypothetical protein
MVCFPEAHIEKMTVGFNIVQDAIKNINIPNLYIDAQDKLKKNARIVTSFIQSLNR